MTISSEAGSQIYMKMTYYAFLQCLGLFYFYLFIYLFFWGGGVL